MIDLAGQMEDHVLALDEVVHGELVAYVAVIDAHALPDRREVEEVTPLAGEHVVDDGHLRAQLHEPEGEVGADEAHAPGDEHLPVAKRLLERAIHA